MNNASLELGGTNWAEKDASLLGYTVSDDSGRFSPQEFTFARGSNLAATRIGKTGLIEKGRENLLLQSNQFDTTWSKPTTSVTSGQSGYDSSSDAWLLSATAAYARMTQSISTSGVNTFSLYAKANTTNFLLLRCNIGGNKYAIFDLSDGSNPTLYAGFISGNATSVGNGWYRISVLFNGSLSEVAIGVSTDGTIAGWDDTTNESIYIQDAQLEQGLAASPYIETTTTSAQAGVLENTPRLNYTTGVANPYLLLEPSRTNLLTQSEYFADGYTAQAISTTANAVVSPEGLQNASKLIPNSGTGGNRSLGKSFTGLSGIHTFSTFAKAGEYGYVALRLRNAPNAFVMFDLNDGLIHNINSNAQYVTGSAKIEDYGNGWYRCSASFDPSGSVTAGDLYPSLSVGITGDESVQWDGDGVSGIYIYGSQFEQGSYATSYIPTYSVSATRAEDDMDTTFSSPLATNGSATIFFHELGVADSDDIKTTGGNYRYQKDTSNYVSLTTTATLWRVRVQGGGTSNFKGLNNNPKTSPIKVAIVVTSSTFSVYANGVKELDNSSLSSTADFSSINDFITIIAENIGVRKSVQHLVFPTALSDADAITLTTI